MAAQEGEAGVEERAIASSPGAELGAELQHRRRYLPSVADSLNGVNGNGWAITSWPSAHFSPVTYDGFPQIITVRDGEGGGARFIRQDAGYAAEEEAGWSLEIGDAEIEARRGDGDRWLFSRADPAIALNGKLGKRVRRDGRVTLPRYDSLGRLLSLEESHPDLPGVKIGLYYTYSENKANRDRLLRVEKRRTAGGVSHVLALSTFDYHSGRDEGGGRNDLRTARSWRYDAEKEKWLSKGIFYYRYHTSAKAFGFPGGLKYELGPDEVARMTKDGFSPFGAPDETLARYAGKHYEYDSARRLASLTFDGGARWIRYRYLQSDASAGRNWARRVIESHSDASEVSSYYDDRRALRLRVRRNPSGELIEVLAREGTEEKDREHLHGAGGVVERIAVESIAAVDEPSTPWENFSVRLRLTKSPSSSSTGRE